MKIKTVSELPRFSGDTNMRMHIHKPGSSESISVNELAGLVTNGGGLQVGDVVLRPNGAYSDALECNGAFYPAAIAPILANKLAVSGLGAVPVGINYNSENRFDTTARQLCAISGSLMAVSDSRDLSFFDNGTLVQRILKSGFSDHFYKTGSAIYVRHQSSSSGYRSIQFSRYGVHTTNATSGTQLVGVVELAPGVDLAINAAFSGGYNIYKYIAEQQSRDLITSVGSDVVMDSLCKSSGVICFSGSVDGVRGLYEIQISSEGYETRPIKAIEHVKMLPGESDFVYLQLDGNYIVKVDPHTGDMQSVNRPSSYGSSSKFKHYDDTLLLTERQISYDAGASWQNHVSMSGYQDADYSQGQFIFVGGTGTTGSSANQSGTVQTNSALFDSDSIFRVPKIRASQQHMRYYIVK